MKMIHRLLALGGGLLGLLLVIQLVPYGRDHRTPPTTGLVQWDSPRTEELAQRACADCHSNDTNWPWYASVAPISWRIQAHVVEGREKLNFSTFDKPQEEAHESAETVEKGEMPPWDYMLAHPEARLSPAEKQELIAGLALTFGREEADGEGRGEHARHDDDD
jgi:mono/diheme cytochrome c family protein